MGRNPGMTAPDTALSLVAACQVFSLEYGLEQQVGADQDQQDGEDRQVHAEDMTDAHSQSDNAERRGKAAHPDAIEVARRVEPQHDQPRAHQPGAPGDLLVGHQPDAADHDQEQTPAD